MDGSVTEYVLAEEEHFCLRGCRTYAQYHKMRRGFEQGRCVFCDLDRKVNKVLFENGTWMMWENPFPRAELQTQLLIVPRAHYRFLWEIDSPGMLHLKEVFEFVQRTYPDLPGGMFYARFGDMRFNAGTVPHLHFHIWVPAQNKEVRIPVFKEEEDAASNTVRMEEFARRYTAGEVPT